MLGSTPEVMARKFNQTPIDPYLGLILKFNQTVKFNQTSIDPYLNLVLNFNQTMTFNQNPIGPALKFNQTVKFNQISCRFCTRRVMMDAFLI